MSHAVFSQLEKVIALADSSHEGEALGALRMARRMMQREGLTFLDLATAARKSQFSMTRSLFSGSQGQWEEKANRMQEEIHTHASQIESLNSQVEFWRKRAFEIEQALNLNRGETERWKEMARETAERMWDLGQIARADAALSDVAYEDVEGKKSEESSDGLKVAS